MGDEAPTTGQSFAWPQVRQVTPGALRRWCLAAWCDLRAAPVCSLFFGVVLALMGQLMRSTLGGAVGLALGTGFLLIGPFLAIGLYEISRRQANGEPVRLWPVLLAWRANLGAVSFFAVALTLLLAAWIRISVVLVAAFFPGGQLAWDSPQAWVFGVVYMLAGGGIALFVFATSSLSLPMLLDRPDMDPISAAICSVQALRRNTGPMLAWGVAIAGATTLGFASAGLLHALVLPLVGHMTWHAYRESFQQPAAGGP